MVGGAVLGLALNPEMSSGVFSADYSHGLAINVEGRARIDDSLPFSGRRYEPCVTWFC